MRIGLDANPIFGSRGGVGWHTYHLFHALLRLKEDAEFVAYVRPGALAHHAGDADLQTLLHADRVRWVETGKWAFRWRGMWDRLDLFHGPNFKLQTTGRHGGVITIHDLWLDRHPEYSTKFLGQRWSRARTRRMAFRARTVITDSTHSADDLVELYGLPRERIAVIPNGVSADFHPITPQEAEPVLRRLDLLGRRYILFVGGGDPRKNHRLLFEAVARERDRLGVWRLVVAGGCVHRFGNIPDTARRYGLEDRLVCAGQLALEELRALYGAADVMVFPSIYEGFGLPVLEAMACGTPVITSNATSIPEVAGDAAVLIDPRSPDELAAALVSVLEDADRAASLRRKGFERIKAFTWDRTARETFEVYKRACSTPAS
jgi:glycosyltransferase involved in cell wall biosynthesis